MIEGMAVVEKDDANNAARLKTENYCTAVEVPLTDGRTWLVYIKGTGQLEPREEALVRATAQLIAEATAELVGVEELVDERPAEVVHQLLREATAKAAAAGEAVEIPPRLFRRVTRIRPIDAFGYHDHGLVSGGACRPAESLHHADCANLFSNNNEGQCLLTGPTTFRCWHGTLT